MPKIMVLRWGHRPARDARLTSHVALVARAFGADGIIISDVEDNKIRDTIGKIIENWGGAFTFEMGTPWKKVVRDWKANDGMVIHLTAYGENIQSSDVLGRIKRHGKNLLVVVGSQKVPSEFYYKDVADFNVAVGNQPHSECASLAVFLDRFLEGNELTKAFGNGRMRIVPMERGKKVKIDHEI